MDVVVGTQYIAQPLCRLTIARARDQKQNIPTNTDNVGRIKNDLVFIEAMKSLCEATTQILVQTIFYDL